MPATVSIYFATHTDCNELSEVIKEVILNIPYYNETARHDEIQKFTSSKLENKISEDKYAVIIAKTENKIIGFCISRFDDYTVWLEWFGVIANFRNQKLSYALLNKLEETVAVRKCHKIWCDCRTLNQASIHILTSYKFTQLVTIPNHWYSQDFILWHKEVRP